MPLERRNLEIFSKSNWIVSKVATEKQHITKSDLIESLVRKQAQLDYKDIELAVKTILEHMAQTLSNGWRIEIRGFGSFSLHYRPPRVGRNPKSGQPVSLPAKYVPHFKPGKQLRERVDNRLSKRVTPIAS